MPPDPAARPPNHHAEPEADDHAPRARVPAEVDQAARPQAPDRILWLRGLASTSADTRPVGLRMTVPAEPRDVQWFLVVAVVLFEPTAASAAVAVVGFHQCPPTDRMGRQVLGTMLCRMEQLPNALLADTVFPGEVHGALTCGGPGTDGLVAECGLHHQ